MTDIHTRCVADVPDGTGFRWYQCKNRSKTEHEGKPYCGVHDPIKKKAREKATSAKWNAKMDASRELHRRANAYPELLKALIECEHKLDQMGVGDKPVSRRARAVLAKA